MHPLRTLLAFLYLLAASLMATPEANAFAAKNRVWDFFLGTVDHAGQTASQVVELHREKQPVHYDTASEYAVAANRAPVDKSWKDKIHGTAQRTGDNAGHQIRTLREAIKEAKKSDVVSVHLDHGYNRGLGLDPKTISPNRRLDVLSVYKNNDVLRIEIQSKIDIPSVLRSRNSALDSQLRAQGYNPLPPLVLEAV